MINTILSAFFKRSLPQQFVRTIILRFRFLTLGSSDPKVIVVLDEKIISTIFVIRWTIIVSPFKFKRKNPFVSNEKHIFKKSEIEYRNKFIKILKYSFLLTILMPLPSFHFVALETSGINLVIDFAG